MRIAAAFRFRSVVDVGQVPDRWPYVQLLEHAVRARRRRQLRHATVRVLQVTEDDGVGGTRLLTRGRDVAVAQFAAFTNVLPPKEAVKKALGI